MAEERDLEHIVEIAIRVVLLGLLVYLCFLIVSPFLSLLVWGAILATAIFPLYEKLLPRLKNKEGLTATLIVLVALTVLIVPVFQMTVSFVESTQSLAERFEAGTLKVPPPDASVEEWPVIGERVFAAWSLASSNIESAINEYRSQLGSVSQWLLGFAAGLGGGVLSFIVSTLVAGGFLAFSKECHGFVVKLLDRLMDDQGHHFSNLGTQTVRSVAQGVIGVALIQAILSAVGLFVMDVPAAGIWIALVLVLAVVQLPPIIILAPIMVYVFSVNETLPSVIFMIYGIIVSGSDAFLKPLFLGRGMDIPMPIILFGAIGGVVLMGILGLFIGAMVLAIGYTLFTDWLNRTAEESPGAVDE